MNDHVVVLGWTDMTLFVLTAECYEWRILVSRLSATHSFLQCWVFNLSRVNDHGLLLIPVNLFTVQHAPYYTVKVDSLVTVFTGKWQNR